MLSLDPVTPPLLSTHASFKAVDYDDSVRRTTEPVFVSGKVVRTNFVKPTDDIFNLRGKRDGAPSCYSTTY